MKTINVDGRTSFGTSDAAKWTQTERTTRGGRSITCLGDSGKISLLELERAFVPLGESGKKSVIAYVRSRIPEEARYGEFEPEIIQDILQQVLGEGSVLLMKCLQRQ